MTMELHITLINEELAAVQAKALSLPRVYSGERICGALDVLMDNIAEPAFNAAEIRFEGKSFN